MSSQSFANEKKGHYVPRGFTYKSGTLRNYLPGIGICYTGRYFSISVLCGYVRATSFSSARTESKTQQNIALMTFVSTWCANIFVGCWMTPPPPFFFGGGVRSLQSFLILSVILKNKKNLCVERVELVHA